MNGLEAISAHNYTVTNCRCPKHANLITYGEIDAPPPSCLMKINLKQPSAQIHIDQGMLVLCNTIFLSVLTIVR